MVALAVEKGDSFRGGHMRGIVGVEGEAGFTVREKGRWFFGGGGPCAREEGRMAVVSLALAGLAGCRG